jgi:two-component system nitrogen regulation response regulator NtrX
MATTSLSGLPAPHRRPSAVLVVEDDADLRRLLENLLGEEGYRCVSRASLEEAIGLLRTVRFALILTDAFSRNPPEVAVTTAPLLAAAGRTPVVLCTAHAVAEEAARAAGFAALVSKPFELEQLLATVAGVLALPSAVA